MRDDWQKYHHELFSLKNLAYDSQENFDSLADVVFAPVVYLVNSRMHLAELQKTDPL